MQAAPIPLKGQTPGEAPLPMICAPLVGRSADLLLAEAAAVAAKGPHLLEWRVDYFDAIADTAQVVALAARIRQAAGGLPLLFTRRSEREGGEPIALTEEGVLALYRAVCEAGQVNLIDFEMDNDAQHVRQVREMSRATDIPLVLSFHDFHATPALEVIKQRFARAASLGADVAKVAVMPRGMDDVLTLLAATEQATRELSIPLVSMSMGPLGAVTRMCGWAFGSAMSFAIGQSSSAPGQMEIADLQAAVALLRKARCPPAV